MSWRPGQALTENTIEALALEAIRGNIETEQAAELLSQAYVQARHHPNRKQLFRSLLRPLAVFCMATGNVALAIQAARQEAHRAPSAESNAFLSMALSHYGYLAHALRVIRRAAEFSPHAEAEAKVRWLSETLERARTSAGMSLAILHNRGSQPRAVLRRIVEAFFGGQHTLLRIEEVVVG